jgi:hypothetical protein
MPRRLRYDPDRDYYDLLQVAPGATAAEIKRAFHRCAKDCHPDRHPDRTAWATARFQAINEAYDVLNDPDSRRDYDRLRWPHTRYERTSTRTSRPQGERVSQQRTPSYADFAKRSAPMPDQPEFARGNPFQAVWDLVRGPFGGLYVIALAIMVVMPISSLMISDWTGRQIAELTLTPASVCASPAAQIASPAAGAAVDAPFVVTGTADGAYRVLLGYGGTTPDSESFSGDPVVVGSGSVPVADDMLAAVTLPTAAAGWYRLTLEVQPDGAAGALTCDRWVFFPGE